MMVGSTCDYLERHGRCPLLVLPRMGVDAERRRRRAGCGRASLNAGCGAVGSSAYEHDEGAHRMILIGFDGSEDARAAIAHAGELFGGQQVTVLTVWERFIDQLVRTSFGRVPVAESVDIEKVDAGTERQRRGDRRRGSRAGSPGRSRRDRGDVRSARHRCRSDPRRGRERVSERDRRRLPRPDRRQVAAAGQRLARGPATRRPDGDRRALRGGRGHSATLGVRAGVQAG